MEIVRKEKTIIDVVKKLGSALMDIELDLPAAAV